MNYGGYLQSCRYRLAAKKKQVIWSKTALDVLVFEKPMSKAIGLQLNNKRKKLKITITSRDKIMTDQYEIQQDHDADPGRRRVLFLGTAATALGLFPQRLSAKTLPTRNELLEESPLKGNAMNINVIIAVDIQAALAAGELRGSTYLIDSNKSNGSINEGTEMLQTSVQAGDVLLWFASGLEVETKNRIVNISFPAGAAVDPIQAGVPPNEYWTGTVKEGFNGIYQYNVDLKVEGRLMSMTTLPSIQVTMPGATSNINQE